MVGLLSRIGIVLIGLALTWTLSPQTVEPAIKVAAALASLAGFGYLVERRGMRSGEWALGLAIVEMVGIGAWLGYAGVLDRLGFLVAAPAIAAIQFDSVQPFSVSPLTGAAFLVGHMLSTKDGAISLWPVAQAVLLSASVALMRPPKTNTIVRTVAAEQSEPAENVLVSVDEYLELRENFRSVRDQYRDLERKSRKDRLVASLAELRGLSPAALYPKLAQRICELTAAEDAAIYTLAQYSDTMVVRAATPQFPSAPGLASVSVDVNEARAAMLHRFDRAVRALAGDEPRKFANLLLIADGRAVGLLTLVHHDASSIEAMRQRAEDLMEVVAVMIREEQRSQDLDRRLAELELLYELSTLVRGANSLEAASTRVVKELAEATHFDHIGVAQISGEEATYAAHDGARLELIDALKFARGEGLAGWLRSGAPELVLFDARSDSRAPAGVTLKRRIGSYFIAPIRSGEGVVGYLEAASHRAGGIDGPDAETLRTISRELSRLVARFHSAEADPEGILPPAQFQQAIGGKNGALVVLELLGGAKLAERHGHSNVSYAVKKLLVKLHDQLPVGGSICRRAAKEFVAFLPDTDSEAASSWANAAVATASLTGIHTVDGQRLPLGLKVKVAEWTAGTPALSHRISA